MPTRNFRITGGNTANSELRLLDGGRGDTDARERYVIYWEVAPSANVTSIESIKLKTQSNDVLFSSIGPTDAPENKHWRGEILRRCWCFTQPFCMAAPTSVSGQCLSLFTLSNVL